MKKASVLLLFLTALKSLLPAQVDLKVHEWGTFTSVQNSNGARLPGLRGENLPAFVADMRLDQCKTCNAGQSGKVAFKNIGVQMETPVLYFYTKQETPVTVDVRFKNGIINQWYPQLSGSRSAPDKAVLDMATVTEDAIRWKATVAAAASNLNTTPPPEQETQEWTAPRNTGSNYVKGPQGEVEKFLFYRGLANFAIPFKAEFNQKGNLVLHNQFNSLLSYVLVYDNRPGHQPTIWWSGALKAQEKKTVVSPAKDSDFSTVYEEVTRFRDELVKAGLYTEEATAMLQTWYDGYFTDVTDVQGLRIFWIAPKSFVDEVLPLQIAPQPLEISRVFVGRSEVLTPDFEKELAAMSNAALEEQYAGHRYLEVLKYGKTAGFPTQWTGYNDNIATPVDDVSDFQPALVTVMPNPFSESMIVSCTLPENTKLNFAIADMQGKIVQQWTEQPGVGAFKKQYSLLTLNSGQYVLQIRAGERQWALKIVKR